MGRRTQKRVSYEKKEKASVRKPKKYPDLNFLEKVFQEKKTALDGEYQFVATAENSTYMAKMLPLVKTAVVTYLTIDKGVVTLSCFSDDHIGYIVMPEGNVKDFDYYPKNNDGIVRIAGRKVGKPGGRSIMHFEEGFIIEPSWATGDPVPIFNRREEAPLFGK